MTVEDVYEELRSAAALEGDRALIRIRTTYQPAAGDGARIYPPTYPTDRGESPYVMETRVVDGAERRDVLLDGVPSQANRAELALLKGLRGSRFQIPLLEISHKGAASVVLTSLELPHRFADAYLRDSEIDGVKFDRTDLGKAFQAASADDVTVLFQHDPGSLVFGAWNSHRKGRQAKFPRIYASEIVGWDPQAGARKAGRMDPLNLTGNAKPDGDEWTFVAAGEKVKGERLSEIGHGNIAPNAAHGGVTITSAQRFATVSFAALDRLGFGAASHEASVAARTALAAYALLADRLAFSAPSLWLRSGCELVTIDDTLEWVNRGGTADSFTLGTADAIALHTHAARVVADLGLRLSLTTVRLTPGKSLAAAIDFALTKADTAGD
ncbi:MAG: type I-G CRISPR-associated RAMP protein Csb1/Cas7g [Dermatophilaceae bacterium]